jgi:hypothetical protein
MFSPTEGGGVQEALRKNIYPVSFLKSRDPLAILQPAELVFYSSAWHGTVPSGPSREAIEGFFCVSNMVPAKSPLH